MCNQLHQANECPSSQISFSLQEEARAKHLASLPPLKKDFYEEDPNVASMPEDEVEAYRYENIIINDK